MNRTQEIISGPLPSLVAPVPGPRSLELAGRLGRVESPDATFFSPEFPVFWDRAEGACVWDVDGNRYLDLAAGFGAAAVGHSHPRVVEAIRAQAGRLIHGMGDVHPHELKLRLAERLVGLMDPGQKWKVIFGLNGADAVEAAMKTAALATGRPGVIAFEGGYHGLSLGTLPVAGWEKFSPGFEGLMAERAAFVPFPSAEAGVPRTLGAISELLERPSGGSRKFGAVLVEPIQGRGGIRIPPAGFLAELRQLCDARGLLLILDEIYTGFGRTGEWFAHQSEGIVPDLVAAGKALGGGMPVSACIGRAEVIDAWGPSAGEARHTSTFQGHPLSCAAALAALDAIETENLLARARDTGALLLAALREAFAGDPCVAEARGRGMMIGIEIRDANSGQPSPGLAWSLVVESLRRGMIVLPSGAAGNVISLSPPLTLSEAQARSAAEGLRDALRAIP